VLDPLLSVLVQVTPSPPPPPPLFPSPSLAPLPHPQTHPPSPLNPHLSFFFQPPATPLLPLAHAHWQPTVQSGRLTLASSLLPYLYYFPLYLPVLSNHKIDPLPPSHPRPPLPTSSLSSIPTVEFLLSPTFHLSSSSRCLGSSLASRSFLRCRTRRLLYLPDCFSPPDAPGNTTSIPLLTLSRSFPCISIYIPFSPTPNRQYRSPGFFVALSFLPSLPPAFSIPHPLVLSCWM
jgi:hypothetical protein